MITASCRQGPFDHGWLSSV